MEEKLLQEVEEKINMILAEGINSENIAILYQLVDIHKDLKNELYWKEKLEMRYNDYNDYGRRGVPGTGRSYRGSYGRRGVKGTGRGRYRGEDVMDEMQEHYMNYNEAAEEMYNGNYGAEGDMVKSVEGIMKNVYEIVQEISQTDSPEIMPIIKKYAQKIEELM